MSYLDGLNEQQLRAVETTEGPVLIIAGPGTGKTKTLTARIAHLLAIGVAAADILALTFTKKAAQEMRQRVGQYTKEPPAIVTFHALCGTLLGGEHIFISEPERAAIIKLLPKPADLKGLSVRELGLQISRAKNMAQDEPALATLVSAYNAELKSRNVIDFDDLLLNARDMLQKNPQLRPKFSHILIDEFQDTNCLQYDILHLLKSNNNIFVIGDPNQSIYGFRGASGTIFQQFKTDFAGATEITLAVNYRSAPEVVALSNSVFPGAPALKAYSTRRGNVRAVQVLNEYSEATWVLAQIQRAIGGSDLLSASSGDVHYSLRDFAILYRSRSAALAVQKYIAESGLPYQIVGEGSPYELPDVQKLIVLLRCASGQIVAVAGFTAGQVSVLLQGIDTSRSPADIVQDIANTFAIKQGREVVHFIGTLVRFGTATDALAYIDAIADQHFYDPQAEAITLLTIHAAKGLEFSHVFLVGAEEGILPHSKADVQEEHRLFYVAVTRAKQVLDITYCTKRAGQPVAPSRFVTDVPDTILPRQLDENLVADTARAKKRHAKRAQGSLF